MRLIDANSLKAHIAASVLDGNQEHKDRASALIRAIDSMPTAYDVDKVVKRLEKMRDTITHNISLNSQGENVDEEILNEISHYQKIIKIVKSGGIE